MDCRTTPAVNFKTRLGFSQHGPIMTQEQSVLSKIVTLLAAEEIVLKHIVLSYRIDAYFTKHKLVIEADEQGHNGKDIDNEIRREKALEKELGCEFIRINPSKEGFDILVEIGKIRNYIAMSIENLTKKTLIDELSEKLLGLEFNSNNSIKTKCLKYVVKKILPTL